ncbi:MAG: hypothetical protein SGI77_01175 [Pirellulaceae bacterium]|nr:hypothetical protein [Pirellulaceae bacterium]
MARLARADLFAPDEIAIVHVMNRVVRRCFLMGNDPVSGRNFDHRKLWVEERLRHLAASFGIDLLGFAILSNHFHLILRSRPDVVATWSDTEVARRWLMICPLRKRKDGSAEEPTEVELNSICNNPVRLAQIRTRLSDFGWWMRLLCQKLAVRANKEDGEVGKFFQSRYRAVRLCDEEAILACSAYVDLNPIRAKLAETLEESDFTSVQRRIEGLSESKKSSTANQENLSSKTPAATKAFEGSKRDGFLSPLTIDEFRDAIWADPSPTGLRCSDKGFLPLTTTDYLKLLDWTARQVVSGKRGSTPDSVPSILDRLSIKSNTWLELVTQFGKLFNNVAGRPRVIDNTRSRVQHRRFNLRREARELLATES